MLEDHGFDAYIETRERPTPDRYIAKVSYSWGGRDYTTATVCSVDSDPEWIVRDLIRAVDQKKRNLAREAAE